MATGEAGQLGAPAQTPAEVEPKEGLAFAIILLHLMVALLAQGAAVIRNLVTLNPVRFQVIKYIFFQPQLFFIFF